jgi:hypothetical protein
LLGMYTNSYDVNNNLRVTSLRVTEHDDMNPSEMIHGILLDIGAATAQIVMNRMIDADVFKMCFKVRQGKEKTLDEFLNSAEFTEIERGPESFYRTLAAGIKLVYKGDSVPMSLARRSDRGNVEFVERQLRTMRGSRPVYSGRFVAIAYNGSCTLRITGEPGKIELIESNTEKMFEVMACLKMFLQRCRFDGFQTPYDSNRIDWWSIDSALRAEPTKSGEKRLMMGSRNVTVARTTMLSDMPFFKVTHELKAIKKTVQMEKIKVDGTKVFGCFPMSNDEIELFDFGKIIAAGNHTYAYIRFIDSAISAGNFTMSELASKGLLKEFLESRPDRIPKDESMRMVRALVSRQEILDNFMAILVDYANGEVRRSAKFKLGLNEVIIGDFASNTKLIVENMMGATSSWADDEPGSINLADKDFTKQLLKNITELSDCAIMGEVMRKTKEDAKRILDKYPMKGREIMEEVFIESTNALDDDEAVEIVDFCLRSGLMVDDTSEFIIAGAEVSFERERRNRRILMSGSMLKIERALDKVAGVGAEDFLDGEDNLVEEYGL